MYESGTSQDHNFVFHHKRNEKQYCDHEMGNFQHSVPTNANQAQFLCSSYWSEWSSSLQAVYMIKPISHPTYFNLEERGTCSSETSVSTYKHIWCRNPKDHNTYNHSSENLKTYTIMTSNPTNIPYTILRYLIKQYYCTALKGKLL
jgi:hypothetical protein